MASSSEAPATTYIDSSSDDECLSAVKRKAEIAEENSRCSKYGEDSDDEPIMAGVLVTVEVEEMDDDCPLEFNKVSLKNIEKYYKTIFKHFFNLYKYVKRSQFTLNSVKVMFFFCYNRCL